MQKKVFAIVVLTWFPGQLWPLLGGVEVAVSGRVLVRDSKDRAGAVLAFTPGAWQAFAARLKDSAA